MFDFRLFFADNQPRQDYVHLSHLDRSHPMSFTRQFTLLLIGCWLTAAALPGICQNTPKKEGPSVVATATATAHVKPDAARVTFNVITTEGSDKSAREANDKQIKRVKDA